MKKSIQLALIQFQSILGEPAQNREKAEKLIRAAAADGAELICLPELFTTGYNLSMIGERLSELVEPLEGPTVTAMQKLAGELSVYLLLPMGLQIDSGKPYNSAVLIGSEGQIIGVYHKCHLFDQEREYFQPGQELAVYATPLGKIGVMICFDAGFPEAARILALKGAEIILCPAAWRIQDKRMWDLNMPQRALENSCYVAAVNRYGQEGSLYMGGFSMACGPEGDILAYQTEEKEAVLRCALDGERLAAYRAEGGPYLPWRRPDLYKKESLL